VDGVSGSEGGGVGGAVSCSSSGALARVQSWNCKVAAVVTVLCSFDLESGMAAEQQQQLQGLRMGLFEGVMGMVSSSAGCARGVGRGGRGGEEAAAAAVAAPRPGFSVGFMI
jgi:hypothetical protein